MAPPTDAGKQGEQSADETIRRRHVSGQTLVSSQLPAVHIDVAPDFIYVDRLQFILSDVAQVESFVFAATAGGGAGRLLVVQFEGYLESNDFTYAHAYSFAENVTLGDRRFHTDAAVADLVPLPPPETDIGRVLRLLQSRGVAIPARTVVQRFVYLLDQAMRNELLILYGEELEGSGNWSAGLGADEKAVRERALRSFALRFTDSGAP